ncbi:zinc finger translocation-associated protein isoform X2 [Syngnathoides biaculeatus]|uniref:zinc finger translocation-associated protein isoform X2 n=1 Tax=Syngnathoides biaculeatus TaxID=300417 RepID=UPI002ADE058B|nr:zinc finger translocation-associated protein isoform X2 [Syngnathoides biaculeatus]
MDAAELRRAERRAQPEPEPEPPLSLTGRGEVEEEEEEEEEEGEDEAAPGHSDSGAEDGLANGHVAEEEPAAGSAASAGCEGATSYWSISEGPDHPLILSPVPGPSGRKPRARRASRPGLSRIPGRDHRRYYHEYWRSEYLMDFDPLRHGMICMVCGSSLATLKLSTIKRHIRQKHPDSLLWSAADKEVIRSGWESHLSLGGGQGSYGGARGAGTPPQGADESGLSGFPAPAVEATEEPAPSSHRPDRSPAAEADDATRPREAAVRPCARALERYLNASLHAWFRQEFLMEYEAEAGRLLCMVCGGRPPSLHLDHIKNHVLERHPDSLVYSSEEKHRVLQAWAQTHDESENSIQSEANSKDGSSSSRDARPIDKDGDGGAWRKRDPRAGAARPLRLDYLVAYGPRGRSVYCMVCSRVVRGSRVRSFRQHIRQCHPETEALSREEREAVAAAWSKGRGAQDGEPNIFGALRALSAKGVVVAEISTSDASVLNSCGGPNEDSSPDIKEPVKQEEEEEDEEEEVGGVKDTAKDATPRHGHYPGKDQRRNYQVRWRTDFLMDYDCRRHGLICMVCGAALATLKVSTIKRHIQQVHAHSLRYGADERRRAALAYDSAAAGRFVHADDCSLAWDHAGADTGPSHAP